MLRRFLQTVDDVLAITDAALRDPRSNLAQEFGVVLFSKFEVDESAQRQALRQERSFALAISSLRLAKTRKNGRLVVTGIGAKFVRCKPAQNAELRIPTA